jgi:hypothetical protein
MKCKFFTAPRNIFCHAGKKSTAISTEIICEIQIPDQIRIKNVFLRTARAVLKRNRLLGRARFGGEPMVPKVCGDRLLASWWLKQGEENTTHAPV